HQQRILPRLPGPSLVDEARIGEDDPIRPDLRGRDLIGGVGHDLENDPEPRVAGELEAEPAQVEDLLRRAGKEHREERVVECDLGVRRESGGLCERRDAPAKFGCLKMSPVRSTPGPLPYHMPSTPSYFGCGKRFASWLPEAGVQPRASVTPRRTAT